MLTFAENLVAEDWFEKIHLGDDDWSELYSLYEHMRDKKGLPWHAMFDTLQSVAALMMLGDWNGKK